jgi:hypothetical protein
MHSPTLFSLITGNNEEKQKVGSLDRWQWP